LEPAIAMQYGYRKKTDISFDLNDLFVPFATMPEGGISCDEDWRTKDITFDDTIAEVFFYSLYSMYID